MGNTPIHLAVMNRRIIVSKVLLEEGGANPNIADDEGKTPLMLACQEGQTDLVQLLLENGADTQLKDHRGWTADDAALMASQDACRTIIIAHNKRRGIPSGQVSQGSSPPEPPPDCPAQKPPRPPAAAAAGVLGAPAMDVAGQLFGLLIL